MFNLSLPCYSLLLLALYTMAMESNLFSCIAEHVFYLVKTISESPSCLPLPGLNKPALLNVPHTGDFLGPWSILIALLWPSSRRFISCWLPTQHKASVQGHASTQFSNIEQHREKEFIPVVHTTVLYNRVKLLMLQAFPGSRILQTCVRLQATVGVTYFSLV